MFSGNSPISIYKIANFNFISILYSDHQSWANLLLSTGNLMP